MRDKVDARFDAVERATKPLQERIHVLTQALQSVKEYFTALDDMRQSGDDGTDGGADFELYMRNKLDCAFRAAGIEIDLTWPHT
jgi:hypothetical protein